MLGRGTHRYYTGVLKLGVLYKKKNSGNAFGDVTLLKFKADESKTYSWSVMQTLFTPDNIRRSYVAPTDYTYAAGLFVTHGLQSVNAHKNISLKSELSLGVLGPLTIGKETQWWFHGAINYVRPQG